MYAPDSLEEERTSWRIVIYFNIARSIKDILETLEAYGDVYEEDPVIEFLEGEDISRFDHDISSGEPVNLLGGRSGSPSPGTSPHPTILSPAVDAAASVQDQAKYIGTLRHRLSPLVESESTLADSLSGGVQVSGSGKGSVYVRRGWQSTASGSKFGDGVRKPRRSIGSTSGRSNSQNGTRASIDERSSSAAGEIVEVVCKILEECQEDVKSLWETEVVQKMIRRRRLRLDEWSEL